MNYIKKVYFFAFLILIYFCIASIRAKKCTLSRSDEVDTCMQKMFLIGDRSQRFRETLDEMHIYCKNVSALQSCVKKYSKDCLPQLARQVTNLMLFGVNKVNKPLCTNDANKIAFTKIAKCGNVNIDAKHSCMDQFIDDLKDTEISGGNKKIPFTCCNFWKFKDCVRNTFIAADPRKCSKKSIDGIINLIGGYAGDAMDLICGEFDENSTDKCEKLLRTKALSKSSRKHKTRARSLLPSFINIFTNL